MSLQGGKGARMRVVVTIQQKTAPELFAHLSSLPPRSRSERLRLLATLGLVARAGDAGAAQSVPDREHETRQRLRARLLGSVR